MSRLADAASENDRLADLDPTLETAVREAGLDMDELAHVAEQRALRAIVFGLRGQEGLDALARDGQVNLSHTEARILAVYAGMYVDGITIGWRAARAEAAS